MIMSLLTNVYINIFPLLMVLSIVLHIYYPILLMKTVSCYNLFYSHFNYCMSSYYVYYCYFMSCCIYFLYNRGFQINNNNNNNNKSYWSHSCNILVSVSSITVASSWFWVNLTRTPSSMMARSKDIIRSISMHAPHTNKGTARTIKLFMLIT